MRTRSISLWILTEETLLGASLVIHHSGGLHGYAAGGYLVQETSDVWSVATAEVDSSGVEGSAILFTSGATVMGAGMASATTAHHAEQEALRPVVSNARLRLAPQVLRGRRRVDTEDVLHLGSHHQIHNKREAQFVLVCAK